MKRKAFILTEILTGMTLQALFALTLCGAFYMLLSFSTNTQKILAAHDEGQIVISYIDNRIRNAGLGMWAFETPENIRKAFTKISAIKNLNLPVAITKRNGSNMENVVCKDGIYSGDVLTLLYARKDPKQSGLIVLTNNMTEDTISYSGKDFKLLGLFGESKPYTNANFVTSFGNGGSDKDISNYAAIESSGYIVYIVFLRSPNAADKHVKISAPAASFTNIKIYPMSELLNLNCERMYTGESTGENSFMLQSLGSDGTWNSETPHTKGILEIFMRLDVNQDIPVLDLKVLVSEGQSDSTTPKPEDWPADYWKNEFKQHKVHVSRASWKLYNLAPLDYTK